MTVAEKQAWMWRYQKLKPELNRIDFCLQEKMASRKELEKLLTVPLAKEDERRLREILARNREKIRELTRERQDAERVQAEIAAAINRLQEPKLRQVMTYHYLEGKSWLSISCRMQYSERTIYYLHRKAMEQLVCVGKVRPYHLTDGPCRMHCFESGEEAA